MIKDIATGFKMLKFGLQAKMLVTFSILFGVLGILIELLPTSDTIGNLSGLYAGLIGIYLFQDLYTTTVSTMIQSSPYKYKFQVYIPCFMSVLTTTIMISVVFGIKYFRYGHASNSEEATEIIANILICGLMAGLLQIYNSLIYKHYLIGLIGLFIIAGALYFVPIITDMNWNSLLIYDISFATSVIMSFVLMFAGAAIGIVLGKAFYKDEISKSAYKSALSRSAK